MFQATAQTTDDKATQYRDIDRQLTGLLAGERDFIANAANLSALIFMMVPDLNWSGFYLLRGDDLLLGPFQGKPACVRIPVFPEPRGFLFIVDMSGDMEQIGRASCRERV